MSEYIIDCGKKEFIGKKLSDISLRNLDEYLGEIEQWDEKFKTRRVRNLMVMIRMYIDDPIRSYILEDNDE